MKIHLYDDLYLLSDASNLMISKRGVDKEGKEYFSNQSYYTSLEGVIHGLTTSRLRESEATSLAELLKEYRDFNKFVKQLLNNTEKE